MLLLLLLRAADETAAKAPLTCGIRLEPINCHDIAMIHLHHEADTHTLHPRQLYNSEDNMGLDRRHVDRRALLLELTRRHTNLEPQGIASSQHRKVHL